MAAPAQSVMMLDGELDRAGLENGPRWRFAMLAPALLLALLLATAPAGAKEIDEPYEKRPPAAPSAPGEGAPAEVSYAVSITGVQDGALLDLLRAASQLKALQGRPPATLARLRQRTEEDVTRLDTALRSEGYYEAELHARIDDEQRPVEVTIEIETGDRYRLANFAVDYQGPSPPPEDQRPSLKELGVELGQAARGPAIVAAQRQWIALMTQRGYPLAKVIERKAVTNREEKALKIALMVESGPEARFGPVTITGPEQVREDHVRGMLPWQEGEIYDSRKIEEARRRLSASGLFDSVRIIPGETTGPDGSLPITLQLIERSHRTIGFGANWSTDIGIGGEVFWAHRNLFGRGEQLHLNLSAAEVEQSAEARFRKPDFLARDQALLNNLTLKRARTDAFNENSLSAFAGMEYVLSEQWRASAGVAPEYSDLDDDDGEEQIILIGVPLVATLDATNDRLNPTRGTRLNLAMTPYSGSGDSTVLFLSSLVGGSAYYALDADSRFVLAGRARLGSVVGESTGDLPANKRLYTGGGGSIRGYEFQTVGPLDDNDDPLGGRSLFELSAEVRTRITEQIGLVPFVDGGTVFDATYPDFDETLRWAAGIGLRYFTGVGPLRIDFAFPLNRRDRDDTFQFYVSFGQAF
jgi:translocation and assembly module TamA